MAHLEETARFLADIILAAERGARTIVSISGAPGSGKTTLADTLCARLNTRHPGLAAIVPMDGFHYDDAVLRELGLLPRKGAIETFDICGLLHMLQRLRDNREDRIAVPVFDRSLEVARAGGRLIGKDVKVVIVEGNYLLVNRPLWSEIRDLIDIAVMIEANSETLRQRLTERWQSFNLTPEAIAQKLDGNDLPNGAFVYAESIPADYRIQN